MNMNSKERLKAALNHKEADRVPIDLGSTKMTGISMTAYRNFVRYKGWEAVDPSPVMQDTIQQLAAVHSEVLKKLGVDTRGVFPSGASAWSPEYTEVNGYDTFFDEWGIGWRKPKESGFYFDMVSHPLKGFIDQEDLDKYNWPDPLDEARTSGLKAQVANIKRDGDYGITMHGVTSGVMEMALRLRSFEDFFVDLAADPDTACYFLDKIVEIKMAYWGRALELVGDDIMVAIEPDDLGTQDSLLISPELYRKYLKPRHKKLFGFIKQKAPHVKTFLHSCGAIMSMVPDLIEAGVDILNPVQVSAAGMDTAKLKKEYGKDLIFWGGGVDTQYVLPFGTPMQVKEEVKRRINDLAPGGGFVFNTVHNIQADVPPENLEAMLEAFYEYGKY